MSRFISLVLAGIILFGLYFLFILPGGKAESIYVDGLPTLYSDVKYKYITNDIVLIKKSDGSLFYINADNIEIIVPASNSENNTESEE